MLGVCLLKGFVESESLLLLLMLMLLMLLLELLELLELGLGALTLKLVSLSLFSTVNVGM